MDVARPRDPQRSPVATSSPAGITYTPDLVRPNMLYGRLVRPLAAGATLESIDDSAARRLPGVTVVRDGDLIGVVAPSTRAAARRGDAAIRATWRPVTGQPSSDTVFDHFKTAATPAGGGRGASPHIDRRRGARLAPRPRGPSSRRFAFPTSRTCRSSRARRWRSGSTASSRSGPARSGRSASAPSWRLRSPSPRIACASSCPTRARPTAASTPASMRSRRRVSRRRRSGPVKLMWTRAEEFSWATSARPGSSRSRARSTPTGGWSRGSSTTGTPAARAFARRTRRPNQHVEFHPCESPLRQGSYRGLAATANHYARETHIDEIARALGIDAVEYRRRHLKDERLRAVLEAAAQRIGWPRASARGSRARHRLRHGEGQLRRHRRGVVEDRRRASASSAWSSSFECGAIVNPDGLRNQVEGGVVQGLGGALFEAIQFADGQILNGTLGDYRVPRFTDMPPIDIVLLDRRDLRPRARARRRSSASRRRSPARSAVSAPSRTRCRSNSVRST